MSKTRRLCISKDALVCLEGLVLAFLSGTPRTLEKSGHSSAVLAVCAPTQISNIFGHILGPSDYTTLRALEKSIPPEDMTRGVADKTLAFGHRASSQIPPLPFTYSMFPSTFWYVLGLSFFFYNEYHMGSYDCFIIPRGFFLGWNCMDPYHSDTI